jgi:tol-pal system protein YbgF
VIQGARRLAFAAAVTLTAGACFATRNDVRLLQADLAAARAEAARADTLHRAQWQLVARQVAAVADSLRASNAFLARFASDVSRFQGDLATSMHTFGQQLIAVQERLGQSQKQLADVRADLEAKSSELSASATPGQPGGGAPAGAPGTGPRQLFQAASAQFEGGRPGAARAAFEDFLVQYPNHELAAKAQFFVGQTYEYESKVAAADSTYQLVVKNFPKSEQAPSALYKRAMLVVRAGPSQAPRAKVLFQQIIDSYPGSPEAEFARDRLKAPE